MQGRWGAAMEEKGRAGSSVRIKGVLESYKSGILRVLLVKVRK